VLFVTLIKIDAMIAVVTCGSKRHRIAENVPTYHWTFSGVTDGEAEGQTASAGRLNVKTRPQLSL